MSTTGDQDRVIAEFERLNAEATLINPQDPATMARLEEIDQRMAELRLLLTVSGLIMDNTGKWVQP